MHFNISQSLAFLVQQDAKARAAPHLGVCLGRVGRHKEAHVCIRQAARQLHRACGGDEIHHCRQLPAVDGPLPCIALQQADLQANGCHAAEMQPLEGLHPLLHLWSHLWHGSLHGRLLWHHPRTGKA